MAENAVSKKPGFIAKAKRFFRDVKGEFKKIVWPGKKQIINNTIIVLVVIVISGIFVGGLDILVSYLVKLLLSLL